MGMRGRRWPAYETIQPTTLGHLRLLRISDVAIDLDGHRVFADSREIGLAPKEFELLRVLMENAGRVLSRRQILDAVWGAGYEDGNKTLEVHIRRLRHKIDQQAVQPRIRTVRGMGYVFDINPAWLGRAHLAWLSATAGTGTDCPGHQGSARTTSRSPASRGSPALPPPVLSGDD